MAQYDNGGLAAPRPRFCIIWFACALKTAALKSLPYILHLARRLQYQFTRSPGTEPDSRLTRNEADALITRPRAALY